MGSIGEFLKWIFIGPPVEKRKPSKKKAADRKRNNSFSSSVNGSITGTSVMVMKKSQPPKVEVLERSVKRPPRQYWQVRKWKKVREGLYLGYFKTRLGRCHGVIKWMSRFNYGVYVHKVPKYILNGPNGSCFTAVKPGKYRVHFYQEPGDLNSLIFYVETLLQEAFSHGKKV